MEYKYKKSEGVGKGGMKEQFEKPFEERAMLKTLRVNLKEFFEMLDQRPEKEYAVAVIDNEPPSKVWEKGMIKGTNFVWIGPQRLKSTERKEIESIFKKNNVLIRDDQPIAVFHHHDLKKPYIETPQDNIVFYEFSHRYDSIVYRAFEQADAKLISHILSKTFHKYEKVVLIKSSERNIVRQLQERYAFLSFNDKYFDREIGEKDRQVLGDRRLGEEERLIYKVALLIRPKHVVADPRRYRPEDHDEIIASGVPVAMYAIPALVQEIKIKTRTYIDHIISKKNSEIRKRWMDEINTSQDEKEDNHMI